MWPRLIGAAFFFGFLLIGNTLNAQEVSAQPMAESIELPLSVPINKALRPPLAQTGKASVRDSAPDRRIRGSSPGSYCHKRQKHRDNIACGLV
jgi:hypothetical protein